MNIFVLSISPKQSAMYHGDKHVIKMLLEACQMLYTAHWVCNPLKVEEAPFAKNGRRGYKSAHLNHPCTKWVRETRGNYMWAASLAIALADEYEYRWPGRVHACREHAVWLKANIPENLTMAQTPFAIAMDPEFRVEGNAISSYRKYYIQSKSAKGLTVYTRRNIPKFL